MVILTCLIIVLDEHCWLDRFYYRLQRLRKIVREVSLIRRGIQEALGLAQGPIGINSAKDAGPWLEEKGFDEIAEGSY